MKYDVVFYYDYKTNLKFVLLVLMKVFGYPSLAALDKANRIESLDKAVVATYDNCAVARAKAKTVKDLAKKFGFPLEVTIQTTEDE